MASTRYVLFLDADAVPEPGWAAALLAALRTGPEVALVAAPVLPSWPRRPPPLFTTTLAQELLGMLDLGPRVQEVPRVMGTSFALDRERIGRTAPFRDELGRTPRSLLAGEEVQLSLDVLAAGGRIRYEPRAVVRHHVRLERLSRAWMLRRVRAAGIESRRCPQPLAAFPRRLGARDRLFQVVTTPSLQRGRLWARMP